MLNRSDYICYGILGLILAAFTLWWILARLGYDKRWFVMPASPFISRNFYFFLPSFLVGFYFGLISMLVPDLDPNGVLFLVAFGFWGLGFVFSYFEPSWLSPEWYRWLKKEHGDILPYLAQEAHELGRQEWLKRAKTEADLQKWVEEFRIRDGSNRINGNN